MPELNVYFKGIIDAISEPVVICDLDHTILYVNPAGVRIFAGMGKTDLVGKSVLDCHRPKSQETIKQILAWFKESPENNIKYEYTRGDTDNYMVAIRDENGALIGYYEKHACRTPEASKGK